MSGSKVVWGFFKWLVIPAGMALVGYYFIGPRINESDVLVSQASKVKGLVEGATESKPIKVEDPQPGKHGKVDLSVKIEKDEGRRKSSTSSRGSRGESNYFRQPTESRESAGDTGRSEPVQNTAPDTGGW